MLAPSGNVICSRPSSVVSKLDHIRFQLILERLRAGMEERMEWLTGHI